MFVCIEKVPKLQDKNEKFFDHRNPTLSLINKDKKNRLDILNVGFS